MSEMNSRGRKPERAGRGKGISAPARQKSVNAMMQIKTPEEAGADLTDAMRAAIDEANKPDMQEPTRTDYTIAHAIGYLGDIAANVKNHPDTRVNAAARLGDIFLKQAALQIAKEKADAESGSTPGEGKAIPTVIISKPVSVDNS